MTVRYSPAVEVCAGMDVSGPLDEHVEKASTLTCALETGAPDEFRTIPYMMAEVWEKPVGPLVQPITQLTASVRRITPRTNKPPSTSDKIVARIILTPTVFDSNLARHS